MAPQTLHLQAVAGRVAASRHPRAQAVIYTGLCICLSRTERYRRETALLFTSQPESGTKHLTHNHTVLFIYWNKQRQRKVHAYVPIQINQTGGKPERWSQICTHVHFSVCPWVCACMHAHQGACVCFQGAWSLPMAEPWKRGFHPGLSLIREGSLIPSHPMLWFICILCQEVMEFCSTVCSENLEDVV